MSFLQEKNTFIGFLRYLRILGESLGIKVVARGHEIILDGPRDRVKAGEEVITNLTTLIEEGYTVKPDDVDYIIRQSVKEGEFQLKEVFQEAVSLPSKP